MGRMYVLDDEPDADGDWRKAGAIVGRSGIGASLAGLVAAMFVNPGGGVYNGGWYDPSDLSTLFQDSGGTTPVTATGQPVGRMLDKSGNGRHVTQATSGFRPIFRDVGGTRWLEGDGVDDFLGVLTAPITGFPSLSAVAGLRTAIGGAKALMAVRANADAIPINGELLDDGGGNISFPLRNNAGTIVSVGINATPNSVKFVASLTVDATNATAVIPPTTQTLGTPAAPVTLNNFAILGSLAAGLAAEFWPGNFYGAILLDRTPTAGEVANSRAYLSQKAGI